MEIKLNEIIDSMKDYLEFVGSSCSYDKKSINKFNKISLKYIRKAKRCKTIDKYMELSIGYIKQLNSINEKCDYELIETDARELIVSMIFDIATEKGFDIDIDDDFTLEYREW